MKESLEDAFATQAIFTSFQWHCEPSRWLVDPEVKTLQLETGDQTDFWARTHYGFVADNGHFLHCVIEGDFEIAVRCRMSPMRQYDQAGLMIRFSPDCWLKTSVEFEPDGANKLGAVATNFGYSDWSFEELPSSKLSNWFRVRRLRGDFEADWSPDGVAWRTLRVAHLHGIDDAPVQCGVYACSPKGRGFEVEFSRLSIRLHRENVSPLTT